MRYSIEDFHKDYSDEDTCLKKIFDLRYGTLEICPKCENKTNFYKVLNRKCYACQSCSYQIYPLAGTVFHKSPTSLKLWFYAIFLLSCSRGGISSKELQRQLGVTYKTAWRMSKQIRNLADN